MIVEVGSGVTDAGEIGYPSLKLVPLLVLVRFPARILRSVPNNSGNFSASFLEEEEVMVVTLTCVLS